MNELSKIVGGDDAVPQSIRVVAFDAFPNSYSQKQEYVQNLLHAKFNMGYFYNYTPSYISNVLTQLKNSNSNFKLIIACPNLWDSTM